MIFGKKEKEPDREKIRNYLAKANHYLTLLDKKVSAYHEQLEKVSRLIDLAARQKEKTLLKKALRAKRSLKKDLNFYLGQQQDLKAIIRKIQESRSIEDFESLIREGGEIMGEISPSPEALEREKIEVGETMTEMETTRKIVSEPIEGSKMEYDIEEEAERLITEKSLPQVEKSKAKKKEPEGEAEIEELKEEIDEII